MTASRTTRRLADGIAVLSFLLLVATVVEVLIVNHTTGPDSPPSVIGGLLTEVIFTAGFGGVGWLLARRVPDNLVGWCFAVGGLCWVSTAAVGGWAELAVTGHLPLGPFARACAQFNSFSWIVPMPFSVQLPLLLLPTGRLLSPRWRPAVWLVGGGVVVGSAGFVTIPGRIGGTDPGVRLVNPMGVTALGPVPEGLALTGAAMLLIGIVVGAVAVIRRFRQATGVQRQQLRWVALGGCGVLFGPILSLLPGVPVAVDGVGATLAILSVPVCVGVAVLRYRLYDLGRLVSRTVSYAILTALLLAVYLVLVTALTQLFPGNSSVGVAASTLIVAALIQPVRRRVQVLGASTVPGTTPTVRCGRSRVGCAARSNWTPFAPTCSPSCRALCTRMGSGCGCATSRSTTDRLTLTTRSTPRSRVARHEPCARARGPESSAFIHPRG